MTLVGWSLVMLIWMVVTRMPAMKAVGADLNTRVGSKPGALDGVIDDKAQWKARSYIHLMERPTFFYAIVFALSTLCMVGLTLHAAIGLLNG